MTRVLVTRPREEAKTLATRLEALGFEPLIEPLIEIRPLPNAKIVSNDAQAVAFTSANGVKAPAVGGVPRDLMVFAVGKATAAAARAAGFHTVIEGNGTVEELATLVAARCPPSKGAILHVSGSVVARDFGGLLTPSGHSVERVIVYESVPAAHLQRQTRDSLERGAIDAVLFFSPRTAHTFVSLVTGAGLADKTASVVAFALSSAVTETLEPLTFARKVTSLRPTTEALLDSLTDFMCSSH